MSAVLVLGGSGYVGGAIAEALSRSGHTVYAGGRSVARRLAGVGIEARACDATNAEAVARAATGVSCIVNSVLGDEATMLAACRNVADVAMRGGLRVIHVSSMAVYGAACGLTDETHPLDGSDSPYGAAKVACEQAVQAFIASGGDGVILRPGIVHGARGEQWTGRLGRMLRHRRLGDLGESGDGRCNLTYIDDLGAAAVAALERPEVTGRAFNVADPDPPTWNQFLVWLGVLVGAGPVRRLSARRLRLEGKVLAPPLQVLKLLAARAKFPPGRLPEPIPPSLLRLFAQDMQLDHRLADAELQFRRTPPAMAMAAAAAWFRAAHGG